MIGDWQLAIGDFLKGHWLALLIGAGLLAVLAVMYGLLRLRDYLKGLPFF